LVGGIIILQTGRPRQCGVAGGTRLKIKITDSFLQTGRRYAAQISGIPDLSTNRSPSQFWRDRRNTAQVPENLFYSERVQY